MPQSCGRSRRRQLLSSKLGLEKAVVSVGFVVGSPGMSRWNRQSRLNEIRSRGPSSAASALALTKLATMKQNAANRLNDWRRERILIPGIRRIMSAEAVGRQDASREDRSCGDYSAIATCP